MMGAGKSTVGPLLARRLGWPFLDTDHEIERVAGRSIAEIFAAENEAGFRRREREAIEGLCGREAVVALGGGAIAQPGAAEWLRSAGTVVFLSVPVEELLERIGDAASRPLLAGLSPAERIARLTALLVERGRFYAQAHHVVDASGPPEEVAERIASRMTGPGGNGS
jgi:shikimate kinase